MIRMYDSIEVRAIPRDAVAVAGYVDGRWPTFGALCARFGKRAHCLSITVEGGHAACLDFERGNWPMGPTTSLAQAIELAVHWVQVELDKGTWRPVVYANASTWDAGLYAAMRPYRSRIRRWVANYNDQAVVPAGYDAHQLIDHGPNGQNYDVSVCRDDFFPGPIVHRPRRKPHPKVTAAGVTGAWVTALLAFLKARGVHLHLTTTEVGMIATAAATIAAQLRKA